MSHSKIPTKTKFARAKGRANRPAKPSNIPLGSTRSGTKQEAWARRVAAAQDPAEPKAGEANPPRTV